MKLAVQLLLEIGDGCHVVEDEADANGGDRVRGFVEGGDPGNLHNRDVSCSPVGSSKAERIREHSQK